MGQRQGIDSGVQDLCRIALTIAELGIAAPEYIALRLKMPIHKVRSAIALMETHGWLEKITGSLESCPCSKCPLRSICPLARSKDKNATITVYRVRKEIVEYCRRVLHQ